MGEFDENWKLHVQKEVLEVLRSEEGKNHVRNYIETFLKSRSLTVEEVDKIESALNKTLTLLMTRNNASIVSGIEDKIKELVQSSLGPEQVKAQFEEVLHKICQEVVDANLDDIVKQTQPEVKRILDDHVRKDCPFGGDGASLTESIEKHVLEFCEQLQKAHEEAEEKLDSKKDRKWGNRLTTLGIIVAIILGLINYFK